MANATVCPAARAATASGTSGSKWPASGRLVNSIRVGAIVRSLPTQLGTVGFPAVWRRFSVMRRRGAVHSVFAVVASGSGPVAACVGAPFASWVVLDEVQDAAGGVAGGRAVVVSPANRSMAAMATAASVVATVGALAAAVVRSSSRSRVTRGAGGVTMAARLTVSMATSMSATGEAAAARVSVVTKAAMRRRASRSWRASVSWRRVTGGGRSAADTDCSQAPRSAGVDKSSCTPARSAQIVFIRRTGAGSAGSTHDRIAAARMSRRVP